MNTNTVGIFWTEGLTETAYAESWPNLDEENDRDPEEVDDDPDDDRDTDYLELQLGGRRVRFNDHFGVEFME